MKAFFCNAFVCAHSVGAFARHRAKHFRHRQGAPAGRSMAGAAAAPEKKSASHLLTLKIAVISFRKANASAGLW